MKSIKSILENQVKVFNGISKSETFKTMPEATYIPFTDASKVFAFEGIIDNAKDVFGPHGGIYMNLYTSPTTKATILSKSRDGHKFFQNLNFIDIPFETVLSAIRERTLYVSGSNGKTSRDGTTSLALISSTVASDVLINRIKDPKKFNIPLSIIKATFEEISSEFRNIVDERKQLIYNPEERSYIGDGYNIALNAIATTVDRDPTMLKAYSELMTKCQEQGVDITESYKTNFPEKVIDSNTGLELKLDSGLRIHAAPFAEAKAIAFKNSKAPALFIDGFLGDQQSGVFMKYFKEFVRKLLTVKDPSNNFYMFSKHNPNGIDTPIFFYNRNSSAITNFFEELNTMVTVSVKDTKTGEIISETIKPRIIFLHSEELSRESYKDLTDIFGSNVIDLDGYRRLITDTARTFLTEEKAKNQNGIPFDVEYLKVNLTNYPVMGNNEGVPSIIADRIKYNITVESELTVNTVTSVTPFETKIEDMMIDCTFDGGMVFVKPLNESHKNKTNEKKAILKENLKAYSKNSVEYEKAKRNMDMYDTSTITPVFTYRTEDEFEMLFDLYEDAQGIFESVHVHGVMGGGNTTLFKVFDLFREKVDARFKEVFNSMENLNPKMREKYTEFANTIVESIFRGYFRTYSILLREDEEAMLEIIERYKTEFKDDMISTYNIIFGEFDNKTLESTRTTVDTFQAMLDVVMDMLYTKRVRVQREKEVVMMDRDFNDKSAIKIARTMEEYYTK
ncbi:MAG: hypothetical protein ACRCX8_16620 [Sarcina sp.]